MSALTQRWSEVGIDRNWAATYEQFARDQVARHARYIGEIPDTGTAGTINTFRHYLGRIPKGLNIINQVTPAGIGPVLWYREATDEEWTADAITLRFDVDNARVLLEVF